MSLEGGPHPAHAGTNDPSEWTRGRADGDTVRGGHLGENGARDDAGVLAVRRCLRRLAEGERARERIDCDANAVWHRRF